LSLFINKNIEDKMAFKKNILITGGAGFIGSHLVRFFVNNYPNYRIINFDKLTYAGNLNNLIDVHKKNNYVFVKGDISSIEDVENVFNNYKITDLIHLAAESHVDRSITEPTDFLKTNVFGTFNLLEVAKKNWIVNNDNIFYHVSTDEVYGSLPKDGFFSEKTPYDPRSPYSASKASSDHFVRAYFHTYKLSIKISNCSNNYGSHQFPEKLIPLIINNIINEKQLPIYGNGQNIRDWLWVEDHVKAIDLIFHKGKIGQSYNIGAINEWKNIDLVRYICDIMDIKLNNKKNHSQKLITFVKDRAGHDQRYAVDTKKIETELNWKPSENFENSIEKTIDWYLNNREWVENVCSGEYMNYYKKTYQTS
jgi:dTDP-glucose 4,6-dehydratase